MWKTAEELKKDRTVAKRAFTCSANSLKRTFKGKPAAELEDFFNKLTKAAEKVWEANDDLEAQLLEDKEEAEEDPVLDEHQKADLAKTASECEEQMDEIKSPPRRAVDKCCKGRGVLCAASGRDGGQAHTNSCLLTSKTSQQQQNTPLSDGCDGPQLNRVKTSRTV